MGTRAYSCHAFNRRQARFRVIRFVIAWFLWIIHSVLFLLTVALPRIIGMMMEVHLPLFCLSLIASSGKALIRFTSTIMEIFLFIIHSLLSFLTVFQIQ